MFEFDKRKATQLFELFYRILKKLQDKSVFMLAGEQGTLWVEQ